MKYFFTLLLLLPAMLFRAGAADFDGYIVRTAEEQPVSLFSLPKGIEPVVPEEGIFRADSMSDISRLWDESELLYIEPDYYVTLFDDPALPADDGWPLEMMGAQTAWDAGLTGDGTRIGIIDSGIYRAHEELTGASVETGHNYLDGSSDTSDSTGHGTFIAGLIAAAHNGKGIDGLAPDAVLVPLKCFGERHTQVSYIVSAIWDSVKTYQCDILNMSFGMESDSTTLREAIDYAAEKGVILCAAVGNSGLSTLNYPAAYDSVIGVGMVDSDGIVAAKSQRNESVWVTAPGNGLRGLDDSGPSSYRTSGGTSYSCPYVSAAAALLKQKYPRLTGDDMLDMLRRSAVDRGAEGYDTDYGWGLVSLPELLAVSPAESIRLVDAEHLRIRAWFPGTVLAALYNGDGRMLRCLPQTPDEQGLLDCVLPISGDTARVKLLCLDEESFAPLRSTMEWSRSENDTQEP